MEASPLLVVVLGALGAWFACRGLSRNERRDALLAFGVHILASVAHWATLEYYYGHTGDAWTYLQEGRNLARLLDLDFAHYAPQVLRLALHLDANLPFEVMGEGSNSGTMSAIAAFCIVLVGPSQLALCLIVSCLAWFGQLCMYTVARDELDVREHGIARVAFMFVPSVVFWSSGFTKEAYVLSFLGVLCASFYRLVTRRNPSYAVGVVVGLVGVGELKAFTLMPFAAAVGAYVYAERAWSRSQARTFRPAYLVLAGALSLGGVSLVGVVFPNLAADQVAETVAHQQASWRDVEGGSNIDQIGGEGRSTAQQVRFVPLAIVNVLFRPSVFDVRNILMLTAAVEDTFLVWWVLGLLRSPSKKSLLTIVTKTPLLVFCFVFVGIFGIGVGLVTSNLGSLSRYRMPMMPFYVAAVLILRERLRATTRAERDAPVRARAFISSLGTSRARHPLGGVRSGSVSRDGS